MAVDLSNNIWILDSSNSRVEEFSSSGSYIKTVASGYGSAHGYLDYPNAFTLDSGGNIWITDTGNNRIEKYNSSGTWQQSIGYPTSCEASPAGSPPACSAGSTNGEISGAYGVSIDTSGNVWVVDQSNARVQEFNNSGTWLQSIGYPTSCETSPAGSSPACSLGATNGEFDAPQGILVSNGYFWVADHGNTRVQKFNTSGTYQGKFGTSGTGNGQFQGPVGIAISR